MSLIKITILITMAKRMPPSDFRAVRTVLEASDFAYAPGPAERQILDLVDKKTWDGLQLLPETVAIFTSNDHGSELHLLYQLWGHWIEAIPLGTKQRINPALHTASLIAVDEFQAATFNALHGYYRVSASCLRSAIEQMTIGVDCAVRGSEVEAQAWSDGKEPLLFGRACDSLQGTYKSTPLRGLFQQADGQNERGWIRSLHNALSDFSHARPGFDAAKFWDGSNGPIYAKGAFRWSGKMWLYAYAVCLILLKIAHPQTPKIERIFSRDPIAKDRLLINAYEYLWP